MLRFARFLATISLGITLLVQKIYILYPLNCFTHILYQSLVFYIDSTKEVETNYGGGGCLQLAASNKVPENTISNGFTGLVHFLSLNDS